MKRIPIQIRVPIVSDKQYCCPYKKPFGYIYKVTNKANGHMYVGKHKWNKPYIDKSYNGSGKKLKDAYSSLKYSENDFEIIIIQWVNTNMDDLNKAEKYWINVFGVYKFPQHYNMTEGGDGMSFPGESNPMYGKHLSEEARLKISVSQLGEKNHNYGKSISEEHRKRISGKNNKNAKSVVQLTMSGEIVRIYSYLWESKLFGFNPNHVSDCCLGNRGSHKGYKWMYKQDYEKVVNTSA